MAQSPPLLNGYFECNKGIYFSNGVRTSNNTASAVFNSDASAMVQADVGINVGLVKINSVTLPVFDNKFYGDTSNSINFTQQHWFVAGGNSIPFMNFMITQPFPEFEFAANINSRALPNDTLNKNDTLYINIQNVQNADSIIINLIDGLGAGNDSLALSGSEDVSARTYLSFNFSSYGETIILPSGLLQGLHVGPKAILTVQAVNYTIQSISGKNFLFKNSYILGETNIYIRE